MQLRVSPSKPSSSYLTPDNAGSSETSYIDIPYDLTDGGVFSRTSDEDQVQDQASGDPWRSVGGSAIPRAVSRSPSGEHYCDPSLGSLPKARPSSRSSTESSFVIGNATSVTSDIASPASTDVTVPSGQTSLRNTPSKPERRVRSDNQHLISSSRLSRTREAADSELPLVGREQRLPSHGKSRESSVINRPSVDHSASILDLWETWRSFRSACEDEPTAIPTLPGPEDSVPAAMPRLNAYNLAEASAEPTTSNTARIDKSSVLSTAGTDTATPVEASEEKTQQRLTAGTIKVAHIAFIGDGLCGKTSLMQ